MRKMNTYGKTRQGQSVLLLIVFVLAALHPAHSYPSYAAKTNFQIHLDNLVVPGVPDWQDGFHGNVDGPMLGTTWVLAPECAKSCDALFVGIHQFSYFFLTPTINAP